MSDESLQNDALINKIASARYQFRPLNAAVRALSEEIDWLRIDIRDTKGALADLEANAWKYAKVSSPGTPTPEKRRAQLERRLRNAAQLLQLAQQSQERFRAEFDIGFRLYSAMFGQSETMLREIGRAHV